jgi:hypothetical protein
VSVLLSVCLSVCLHVSARIPLDGFPQNSILVTSFKNICQNILNLTRLKKNANLHDHFRRFTAAGDTNSQQRHLSALFDIFLLLTVTYSSTIRAKSIFAISIARMVTWSRHNVTLHVHCDVVLFTSELTAQILTSVFFHPAVSNSCFLFELPSY